MAEGRAQTLAVEIAVIALVLVCIALMYLQDGERKRWELERSKLLDRIFEQNVSVLHNEWRKDAKEPEPAQDRPVQRGVSLT